MASITITVPDALVPRLISAMRAVFPQYSGLTDLQAFKRITGDYWINVLAGAESQAASIAADSQARTDGSSIG